MFTKAEQDSFYRAVESRDYRFDGRFFTGVKTTGIYCRPVCPAKPKRQNIEFFKTAAAAENAGYRPCLRCRPEVAPRSPAWIGTSATVKRAIALIGEGQLFQGGEKQFALKLGMSDRHLRRLFMEELGMTAKQVSDNQRLNFARTLITETNISITDIALSSGFNSIRRFNDAFQKKFSRKPSEVRKKIAQTGESTVLFLRYRPPYNWHAIISFLKSHSMPEIEKVTDQSYQRLFVDEHTGKPALLTVTNLVEVHSLRLEVVGAHTKSLFSLAQKVRRMFDLDSDPILIANAFSQSRTLAKIYDKNPGLRIPTGWDAFETAVATVLGQFVSVEHGRKLLEQLINEHGATVTHNFDSSLHFIFPKPEVLQNALLTSVKTTSRRKQTIRDLAKMVLQKQLDLSDACDLATTRRQLDSINGIGPWTIEYVCLRALGDTDAFPAKDLILARVLERHPEIAKLNLQP